MIDGQGRSQPEHEGAQPAPLAVLGLDSRGARVYAHLCVHGPTTAGAVAAATRLGRGDVYRSLGELVARRCVVKGPARPARYAAVDPAAVFAREIAQTHRRKAAITEAAQILAQWWAQNAATPPTSPWGQFRYLVGKAEIEATAWEIASGAKRVLLLMDGQPSADARAAGLGAEALRAAAPASVELRVVPAIAARSRGGTDPSWFLVADGVEALLLDATSPGAGPGGLRAAWTDSPALVAMAGELHAILETRIADARVSPRA